jgi:hypothetical protein
MDMSGVRLRERRMDDEGGAHMFDISMLVLGLGFFALSVGYAYACDRL